MAKIRSFNELVLNSIAFYSIAQPDLDTKPGTVVRDVFIDGPATQVAAGYDELNSVSVLQSLRTAVGSDLDKLALNWDATRRGGSKAANICVMTFNSLNNDFLIPAGKIIGAKNGSTFIVKNNYTVSSISGSFYKAVAAKYASDLSFLNITDQYAVEILIEATAIGAQGNISKYSLNKVGISGINNVFNAIPFSNGKFAEDDNTFRNRVLAIFSGSNTGTATGYENAAKTDSAVIDAITIQPGDTLMTRDGTVVETDSSGNDVIVSEGSGGKVDLLVFGSRLQEVLDGFIYHDKSNTKDPTHPLNDFVLGQIRGDENKTITRKRIDNMTSGTLPNQPVNNIISVVGSISGANFKLKTTDEFGRVSGNYELIRDTGSYQGSPWSLDRVHWISNKISGYQEDKTKNSFNNQDTTNFSDVLSVNSVTQDISITNENSQVLSSDRSIIQLSHYPCNSVTRVFNVTTGERYTIVSQNVDGTGTNNLTGRIRIGGKSLPSISDILQVDYTWVFSYDRYFDFDNKEISYNSRSSGDTIDWGYSNLIKREQSILIASGDLLKVSLSHPISSVINCNVFDQKSSSISLISSRLSVVVDKTVNNVVSITRDSDGRELWDTNTQDGAFSGMTIYLPSDISNTATVGQSVTVIYNAVDVFGSTGNFNESQLNITSTSPASAGKLVECTYIANVSNLLPSTLLSSLPAVRSNNKFVVKNNTIGMQPTSHIFDNSNIYSNLRIAPSNLGLQINGTISPGNLAITGTTFHGIFDAVLTVSNTGLRHNLSSLIKSFLGISSVSSIPSNVKISRVCKVELVTADDNNNVLSSDYTYDLKWYSIKDNSFCKNESIQNNSMNYFEFELPFTSDNYQNSPSIGDKIRVSFYISIGTEASPDVEILSFTKSGTLYTNKKFALVKSISISSGFSSNSSGSATLTVFSMNQPLAKSRYKSSYEYSAPKENERISISYNYDKLVSDVTQAIEVVRPINSDVLVKNTNPVLVDATLAIVISEDLSDSEALIIQNVINAVTTNVTSDKLGLTVDASDLINIAYSVSGVDRARIVKFNKSGNNGSVLSISAKKNQYLVANNINVYKEKR